MEANVKKGTGSGNYQNYILTLLVLAVNVLLLGFCFDFYYDLNDDTMMLDIMAGAYSGTPDGHNMQTLYPLGAVIALCYRVWGSVPWYGLFLCLCQFGCFWLAAVRLCALAEQAGGRAAADGAGARRGFSIGKKLLLLLVWSLFVWGVCLAHVVNIQYTVTSAMLSATALFLFLTARDTDNVRRFLFQNIPSVVLVILAYQLRSEMLLLTFPFICLAGLCRLTGEKRIFERTNFFKYGGVLGIMLAGMLLSGGIDYGAYGSAQWQDFLKFFEARTTIYDFYPELVTEESHGAQLSDLGVPAYQQALLRNYDYGLDETIDTAFLTKLAGYATKTLRGAKDWSGIVKEQAYRYFYRTFRGGDRPYSTLLLLLYAAVLAAGCRGLCGQKRPGVRSYAFLWQLALLAAGRTAVWMFILLRGREPERITHSLYLVEYALLAALAARMIPGAAAAGVGAKIPGAVFRRLGYDGKPGISLFAQAQKGIPFIVLEQDIVFRLMLFNQGAFQQQRLKFRAGDDGFKFVDLRDHFHRFGRVGSQVGKILAHPVFQRLGLADVDDGALGVLHNINAGQQRQQQRLFLQLLMGQRLFSSPNAETAPHAFTRRRPAIPFVTARPSLARTSLFIPRSWTPPTYTAR